MADATGLPPAGWYDDPQGQGMRWWDGQQWSDAVQPRTEPQPPAQPAAPVQPPAPVEPPPPAPAPTEPPPAAPTTPGAPIPTAPVPTAPIPTAPVPTAGGGRSRLPILIPVAALVLAAAVVGILFATGVIGGGGGRQSVSEFRKSFAPVDARIHAASTDLGKTLNAGASMTDVEFGIRIRDVDKRVVAGYQDLKKLEKKAPKSIEPDLTQMADTLGGGVHGDLVALASAADTHDANKARASTTRLIADGASEKLYANKVRAALGLPTH